MTSSFEVSIVDDDVGVLRALSRRLRIRGYSVRTFACPAAFLEADDVSVPGCAIVDLAMPGMTGLELQRAMIARGAHRPIIFLTGRGDISVTVRAMRAGAVDFLTKPVDDQALLDALARAEALDAEARAAQAEHHAWRERLAMLTPREREIIPHVLAGKMNKDIAADLGIVEQTIKVHRRRMMTKLGIGNVIELARIFDKIDL